MRQIEKRDVYTKTAGGRTVYTSLNKKITLLSDD